MQFSGWSGEFLKIACSWFTFCFCAFLKFLVVVKGAEWRTCWRWANTRGVNCNIFSHTRKENAWKAEIFERFSSFFFAFFFVNRDNGGGRTCVCVCATPAKGFLSYTFVYRRGGFKSLSVSSLCVLRLEIMHGGKFSFYFYSAERWLGGWRRQNGESKRIAREFIRTRGDWNCIECQNCEK